MRILLYSFFTNDYVKLIEPWLKYTATRFYNGKADILIVTDNPDAVPSDKNIIVRKMSASPYRNQNLWHKNKRHMEVLDEFKDSYDVFAHIQSNCFCTKDLDETNFPIDKDKLTVFEHTGTGYFDVLTSNICKIGSCGYRSLSRYDNHYCHSGIFIGDYENTYNMCKSSDEMYVKDKSKGKLHKVPYHDESYLNSWIVDNKDKVTIRSKIPSGEFANFEKFEHPLFLVDKHCFNVMKNKYIIPLLIPNTRFGNHLFLIATCYAHCLRNGYELRVPNDIPLIDKVFVDEFNIPQKADILNAKNYHEPTYSYSPIPNDHVGFISGFYQSSKYFSEYKKEIRDLFKRLRNDVVELDSAIIHVRMGDYLKLSGRYKSPTKDYIERALARLSTNIKRLYVCSDEVDKAVELVKSCKGSEKYEVIPENSDEIFTLKRITSCQEFIMSCSSFSWWGAYLGNHNKVIVDKKWYNDNELEEKDIYEDDWVKI